MRTDYEYRSASSNAVGQMAETVSSNCGELYENIIQFVLLSL